MLSNPRADPLSDALLHLLLRFQNVVLWLNGHIHANRITARPDPHGRHGFWEVTTSSIVVALSQQEQQVIGPSAPASVSGEAVKPTRELSSSNSRLAS